ncbi:MAG: hypothetical protein Q9224_002564, partial [Gallowayella concinna]
ASQSPWLKEFRELTEPLEEERTVRSFTQMNKSFVTGDTHRVAMDLIGVSDFVRVQVEARRQEIRDKARQRLETFWGADSAPEQLDQPPATSSAVVDLTDEVNYELNLRGEDDPEDNGPDDDAEWGLPGFTST